MFLGEIKDTRPWIRVQVHDKTLFRKPTEYIIKDEYNFKPFTYENIIRNFNEKVEIIKLSYTHNLLGDSDLKSKSFKVSNSDITFYNYFNPASDKYEFYNLRTPAVEFITKLKNEKQQAKSMISKTVKRFPWENVSCRVKQQDRLIIDCVAVNYIGNHKNFSGVF